MTPKPKDTPFPVRLAVAGIAAMVGAVLLSAALTWSASNKALGMAHTQFQVQVASTRLEQLIDRRPTATFRLLRNTSPAGAKVYDRLRADFAKASGELDEVVILEANGISLKRIQSLEAELALIESRALSLRQEQGVAASERYLESQDYRGIVSQALAETTKIQHRSGALLSQTEKELRFLLLKDGLVSLALGIAMIFAAWFFVIAPARKWGLRLNAAQREIEASANAKSSFLATMSHEIRTPLNSIIGFSDLLASDPTLSPTQRRQIDLIQNSGSTLLMIINDILDVSKLEAGKVDLRTEPFSIHSLIDNTVSMIRNQAERKQVALDVHEDSSLSDYYVGDEHRIRQVLLNLLNNAVKFTEEGSVALAVDVRHTSDGEDRVVFTVTDTGEGIAEDDQDRLFQIFTQVNNSMRREAGGTGLGLAISKRLVELMGGTIEVDSDLGMGSTFRFDLPLRVSAKVESSGQAYDSQLADRLKILLVEDLPINQELATIYLRRMGHEVDLAVNGQKAVDAVSSTDYDLVLMDMQMPVMDGLTATRTIRQLEGAAGSVPIIAMTANVLPEQIKIFREAGVQGLVPKPIKESILAEELKRVVGERVEANATTVSTHSDGVFDAAAFDKLQKLLPPQKLSEFLRGLESRIDWLTKVDDTSTELGAEAHKLVSQSGMLGFKELSEFAVSLERAAESGRETGRILAETRQAAARAAGKIGALRNGLDDQCSFPAGEG